MPGENPGNRLECFRTQMSAAPLKPGNAGPPQQHEAGFPHSDECGPIEATETVAVSRWNNPFPHSDECGPIEASATKPWESGGTVFPHSDECGPIEAPRPTRACPPRSGFRTQMSAAPLKLEGWRSDVRDDRGFRTQMSAAPLKRLRGSRRRRPRARVSALR